MNTRELLAAIQRYLECCDDCDQIAERSGQRYGNPQWEAAADRRDAAAEPLTTTLLIALNAARSRK